ncbi:MAG: CoA-acylating methylmalonate-semialdehyde dehydrogenase [Actinomycetota bacterium]|nr:CoA-acylating methylmalonate-semialdehyde dehydrogenase [Actinomycetota bacterium]
MRRVDNWIGGAAVAGAGGRAEIVTDPADGEEIARVDFASPAQVNEALTGARAAFEQWRDTSLAARTKVLFAFRQLLDARRDEVAAVVTAEHGKTRDDALGEVQRALEVVEFACGAPHLLKGAHSDNVSTGVDAYSIHEPVGVVVGITPFNFPAMVPAWMFPVALACGNAFVLKPSEKDPSASLFMAQMWADAGLPEGLFTVLHGDRELVEALLVHPEVDAVSFVGSTPVARRIYDTATGAGKRVQALGGAKNHMVVLPDADLDVAADAAVSAAYGSAGERCMAISVVVAVEPSADGLVERITERIGDLRVGAGAEPGVEMGPLVTAEHLDRVRGYVGVGESEGARVAVDGRDLVVDGHEKGYFLGPTLLDCVDPAMTVYRDEIFGPVLSVVRVDSFDEAVAVVNANPYGNGTAVFTNDGLAARRYQREVQVGMIGVNVPIPAPMAYYSFGGWKQSLFGDAHVHGTDGVRFYTRTKAITARWPEPSPERAIELGFPTAT